MRILLVSPHVPENLEISPPYGLSCIAAYLKKMSPGKEIDIIDLNVEPEGLEEIDLKSYHLLGFGFTSPPSSWVYAKTRELKETDPELLIVHGGVHATSDPEASLLSGADVVVRGEGEVTFDELTSLIERDPTQWRQGLAEVHGISYRVGEEFLATPDREFVRDLDQLAYADWSYFDLSRYNHNLHVEAGFAFPIMATRGCPFDCNFCCSPGFWKRRLRCRSVQDVVAEIRMQIEKFGIRRYHFYDDDFLANPKYASELCKGIIEAELDIRFVIMARSDSINRHPELLSLLQKAGCIMVEFGVESTDPGVLASMNKMISLTDIRETSDLLREAEITPFFLLMFAYDGETMQGLYYTNSILVEIQGFDSLCRGAYAQPYPGSKFAVQAEENGILLVTDCTELIPTDVSYIPNSILQEVPVQTIELNDDDLDYLSSHFLFDLRKYGIEESQQMILELYNLVDGVKTVGQLLEEFVQTKTLDRVDGYRFAYRYFNYFAQLGIVRAQHAEYSIQEWYKKKRDKTNCQ